MSDHGHGHEHAAADHHDHGGTAKYWAVFFALCLLTSASFLTYWETWRLHVPVEASRMFMMAIAVTKASLVMLFFMHLKWEAAWKYVLTIPTMMMAVFLMLALIPDVGLRTHHYSEERQKHAAAAARAADHAPHAAHPAPGGH